LAFERLCGRELVECNELDTALKELAEYGELGMDPETTSARTRRWWEEQPVRVGIWVGVRTAVWKGAGRV
jgi:hypothetical protein